MLTVAIAAGCRALHKLFRAGLPGDSSGIATLCMALLSVAGFRVLPISTHLRQFLSRGMTGPLTVM